MWFVRRIVVGFEMVLGFWVFVGVLLAAFVSVVVYSCAV